MTSLLIIFVRNPILGKVKTRLAKTVGDDKAIAVYEALLIKTKNTVSPLKEDVIVYYDSFIPKTDIWDEVVINKNMQKGKCLGEKMQNAFAENFTKGYKKICIIGSDLWDLKQEDITRSFDMLNNNEVVIGPAIDGGYYLLGLNKIIPSLFKNKKWGSNTVLKETMEDLKNYTIELLDTKNDIDNEDDLSDIPELLKIIK